ncbi:MAG: hypothetical protein ACI4PQ_04105 [Butyricicoccaceae bacterium]
MRIGSFAFGVAAGLAGAAAASVAMSRTMCDPDARRMIHRTAEKAADSVSHAAHAAADML